LCVQFFAVERSVQNHVRLQMIVADDGQDFSLFAFAGQRSYDVKIDPAEAEPEQHFT